MALDSLSELDHYSRSGAFPAPWDDVDWGRPFVAPEDDISGALAELVRSAGESLFLATRSLTAESYDAEFVGAVLNRLTDPDCYVQLTAGALPDWMPPPPLPNSSVAIGEGFVLEIMVIDATDIVLTGHGLVVLRDPTFAAWFQARLAQVHTRVLAQQKEVP